MFEANYRKGARIDTALKTIKIGVFSGLFLCGVIVSVVSVVSAADSNMHFSHVHFGNLLVSSFVR